MENLEQTIVRILAGDPDLYRDIVGAYEQTVRATVAAMAPDPNSVPDLTQETFIIAFQRLSSYQPGTNFVAWLRTIARNVAQNERRRWYRRRALEERSKVEVMDQIEARVDSLMEELPEDLVDSLKSCVGKLQGKTRAVLDGFYFKDHSINELADLLQIPAGTAKVMLHRARGALGSCLQKKGACHVE